MKPKSKLNLLIWCGYMLGYIYACCLDYIPGGWKWVAWGVMLVVLVLLMMLSDWTADKTFQDGVDYVLYIVRYCQKKGGNTIGQQNNG